MKGMKDMKKIKDFKKRIERIKADQNGSPLPAKQSTKQLACETRSILARNDPF
jgi:hypothetical protein